MSSPGAKSAGSAGGQKPSSKSRYGLLIGGVVVVVILALALGLGLGLGLHHHHSAASSASTSSPASSAPSSKPFGPSTPANATLDFTDFRKNAANFNLSMDWDLNAPPTTRVYNFTISEVQAAPDGGFYRFPASFEDRKVDI